MNVQRGKASISPPVQISAQHPQRTVSAPPSGATPPPVRPNYDDYPYQTSGQHHYQTAPYVDMSKTVSGRMPGPAVNSAPNQQFMRPSNQPQYLPMESQEPMWPQQQAPYYSIQQMRPPRMPLNTNGQLNSAVYISGMPNIYSMPSSVPPYPAGQGLPILQQQPNQFNMYSRVNYSHMPQQQMMLPQPFTTQGGAAGYGTYMNMPSFQIAMSAPNTSRPPSTGSQGVSVMPAKREKNLIKITDPNSGRDLTNEILHQRPQVEGETLTIEPPQSEIVQEFAAKVAATLSPPDTSHEDKIQTTSFSQLTQPSLQDELPTATLEVYYPATPYQGIPPQEVSPPVLQQYIQPSIQADPEIEVEPEEDVSVINGDIVSPVETNVMLASVSYRAPVMEEAIIPAMQESNLQSDVPSQEVPSLSLDSDVTADAFEVAAEDQSYTALDERDFTSEQESVPEAVIVVPDKLMSQELPVQKVESTQHLPVAASLVSESEEQNYQVSHEMHKDAESKSQSKDARKSKRNKKDLNKRGESKEGTDMDAFYDAKAEDASSPLTPENEPVENPADTLLKKSKDKPPQDRTRRDSETSKPPRKNENMLSPPEVTVTQTDESPENGIISGETFSEPESLDIGFAIKKKIVNGVELRYNYKEDQWSPLNPEGKRQYDRDFLLMLQRNPESNIKPTNLPDLPDIILDKPHSVKSNFLVNTSSMPDFTPGFFVHPKSSVRSGGQGSLTKRGSAQGRRSAQGPGASMEQRVIRGISLNQDIQLHRSDNAYKIGFQAEGVSRDQVETEKVYRQFKGILNKLTPQKFQTLVDQALALPINVEERLICVTDLIFEKALSEPNFSVAYANMCKAMLSLKAPATSRDGEVTFRHVLLSKCQKEFEKDNKAELDLTVREEEIEAAPEEKKAELREALVEATKTARRRSTGNIRFIGELFKLRMLTESIMHQCVFKLLKNRDEESLECLCRLLTTIGKDLDQPKAKMMVDQYFQQMGKIKDDQRLSSRVRFMIQDVIDLRQNDWVPRRAENKPKTIDQIHKDAAAEQVKQQMLLASTPAPRQEQSMGPRGKGGKVGRSMQGGGGSTEEGWNTVSTYKPMRQQIDASKMKLSRPNFDDNINLGPGGGAKFSMWGKGSQGGGSRSQEAERNTGNNRYTLLSNVSDGENRRYGKSPARGDSKGRVQDSRRDREGDLRRDNLNRGKVVARSSQESERERTVASARNLLGASASSNPPSRDSSQDKSSRDVSGSRGKPDSVHKPEYGRESGPDASKMSVDAIENKIKAIAEEYLHNGDINEAKICVAEWKNLDMSLFVSIVVTMVLERSSHARMQIGELLFALVAERSLDYDQLINGLKEVMENAEDFEIDVPRIWEYLGELFGPMIADNHILPLAFLKTISQHLAGNRAGQLVASTLHFACQKKPHSHISAQWKESRLKISDFVGDDADFVKRKELEWLEGSPSRPSGSHPHSAGWIQDNLLKLLDEYNTDNERIFDWIEGNISEEEQKSKQFIRELTTAVCQSAMTGQGHNARVVPETLKNRNVILLKYLENKPANELQALYALQALIHKLEHPPGVLRSFFDLLYDDDIISEDSFYQWEKSNDPAEREGKSISLLNTNQFFVWLREAEDPKEGDGQGEGQSSQGYGSQSGQAGHGTQGSKARGDERR